MTDIVAELRRLYAEAPQGEWVADIETDEDDEQAEHLIYDASDSSMIASLLPQWNGQANAELIVAMHNHLPALLDAVEAWRAHEAHMARRDIDDAPDEDSWLAEWEVLNDRACTALEALGRSDA